MNYKITIVVSTESENNAKQLMLLAAEAVKDNLDLDEEDLVAKCVEPEQFAFDQGIKQVTRLPKWRRFESVLALECKEPII